MSNHALLIEEKSDLLDMQNPSSGRTFVLPTEVCEKHWERPLSATGNPSAQEIPFLDNCVSFPFRDDKGFPLIIEHTRGLERLTTVNTYRRPPPPDSKGNLGLIESSELSSVVSGDSAKVTTSVTYYDNGLPHTVTSTPTLSEDTAEELPTANRRIVASYDRNPDGQPERITIAADSGGRHPVDNTMRSGCKVA